MVISISVCTSVCMSVWATTFDQGELATSFVEYQDHLAMSKYHISEFHLQLLFVFIPEYVCCVTWKVILDTYLDLLK